MCGRKSQYTSNLTSQVSKRKSEIPRTIKIILIVQNLSAILSLPKGSQDNGDLVTYSFIKYLLRDLHLYVPYSELDDEIHQRRYRPLFM